MTACKKCQPLGPQRFRANISNSKPEFRRLPSELSIFFVPLIRQQHTHTLSLSDMYSSSSQSPSMFSVRQLDFDNDRRRSRSSASDACMTVGVIVVFYFLITTMAKSKPSPSPMYYRTGPAPRRQQLQQRVRSMLGRFVSAKASTNGTNNDEVFGNASDHYTEISPSQQVKLIQAGLRLTEKLTPAKITQQQKADCQTALLEYLQDKKKAIIMVFAPWCGHCHNMMPVFAAASTGLNAIMVNGDCLPENVMAGTSQQLTIPAVGHYPFLMVYKDGRFTKAGSPNEAVEMYHEEAETAEGDSDKTLGAASVASTMRSRILQPDSTRFVSEQDASPSRGMPAFSSEPKMDTSFMDSLF